MKKIILLLSLFIFAGSAFAQEADVMEFVDSKKIFKNDTTGWKKGGYFGLNGNSVGLSNWAAGGQQSVSIGALADVFAIYSNGRGTWENYGKFGYGAISLTDGNEGFQKNEDNVDILSKYGYKIVPKRSIAGLVQLQTQIFQGYDPENLEGPYISNAFAPAFGLLSFGLDYKPKKHLSLYVSPATGKFTIVGDERLSDAGAYGVDSGSMFRTEIGAYFKMMYQKDVMKNINLQSRLDLFANYETIDKVDLNWENTLNMKVNKYISAFVFVHLRYDHDIDTKPDDVANNKNIGIQRNIQFKYVIGVGLAYKIGDVL
jgi:hypothetical protein